MTKGARRRLKHFSTTVALVGIFLATGGPDCGSGSSGGGGGGGTTGPPEIMTACCSNGNVANYVKINDNWDPTSCGSPSSIIYNVCTYQRYDNKAIGTVMNVCSGQQPAGWVMDNTFWSPTACGHPSSIIDNMWTIRRVS